MDADEQLQDIKKKRGFRRYLWVLWLCILYAVDRLMDALGEKARLVRKESTLFVGVAVFLLGILNFESDKYCDGNTGDYLSCTRPTTYYYFDSIDIILIILGAFFILFWVLDDSRRAPAKAPASPKLSKPRSK